MALIYCPNCHSANSSCERRCWICQKALALPPANPSGRPLTYPQKMRLVRFEETMSDGENDGASRIVYVKSVEDDRPIPDYWQALRDQQMLKLRRIYAGAAAALSLALAATFFILSPAPAQPPLRIAAPPATMAAPDNPLAHTILPPPPPPATESDTAVFASAPSYQQPFQTSDTPSYSQAESNNPPAQDSPQTL